MSSNAPIPDTAQVFVNWTFDGQLAQNQLFFHHWSGPVSQADLDLLRTRVANAFRNNFVGALGLGTVLRSVECRDRSPTSTLTSSVVINRAPLSLIRAIPAGIALSLIQYVVSPLEVHPSRAFVGGARETQVTGNDFDPAAAASLLALWATNNASHGPFGWHHCRVSLYLNGIPRLIGVQQQIVGYALAHLRVSQQRRRQPG
jgi:hypothetical protein